MSTLLRRQIHFAYQWLAANLRRFLNSSGLTFVSSQILRFSATEEKYPRPPHLVRPEDGAAQYQGRRLRSRGEVIGCLLGAISRQPSAGPPGRRPTEAWKKGRSRPVSRVLSWTVIPLGASSPIRSSNLPGGTAGRGIASLFGLAPGGVCRAGLLPGSRCALTAPFHPCLCPATPLPPPERPGRLRRQA